MSPSLLKIFSVGIAGMLRYAALGGSFIGTIGGMFGLVGVESLPQCRELNAGPEAAEALGGLQHAAC
jgi:hypothetical protein